MYSLRFYFGATPADLFENHLDRHIPLTTEMRLLRFENFHDPSFRNFGQFCIEFIDLLGL